MKKQEQGEFIERQILIGLIVSTDYFKQVYPFIDLQFFQSYTARLLIRWCVEYYNKFQKAPGKNIEALYYEHLKKDKLSEDFAEEIEQEILPDLADLFLKDGQKVDEEYLKKITIEYFKVRFVQIHEEKTKELIEQNDIEGLELEISSFSLSKFNEEKDSQELDMSDDIVIERLREAFENNSQTVLVYPGALGEFWNDQMIRGGLVGIMAPEKRGKTFFLMDMALRAARQGRKVLFFQAGDMTEAQQMRRIAINLTGKSDKERYVGKQYVPVKDCVLNQLDTCDKDVRTCNFGIFDGMYKKETLRKDTNKEDLLKAYKDNKGYEVCHDCLEYKEHNWGAVWMEDVNLGQPLTIREAEKAYEKFFLQHKKQIKLITYPNDTLTINELKAVLSRLKSEEHFIPDLLLIDYADLLVAGQKLEFRHQQNYIWKSLRGISQIYNCLVITPTQTDADSYKKDTISLSNYSEDKRKYAHVTAMYGLSQDKEGREKKLGVMRITELLVREGGLERAKEVYVLQSLKQGRPFLTSFF